MSAEAARKTWELENKVAIVDAKRDAIYSYDKKEQTAISDAKPWTQDPNYFKSARISAVALLKMTMHARSGGNIEIMGLMLGKIHGNSIIVLDSFPLPVEGTETRVNAQNEAYEYMASTDTVRREIGRQENIVGWYHSHPGYGCWLSGIDVSTEMLHQKFNDPFLAVVVDPDRTISAGKVEIGAFRTFPEGYKPPNAAASEYQTIPLSKIEDFGAHSDSYYPLEVTHFRSSLDTHLLELLWNKYWVSTLSQSPLFMNRDYSSKQMADLSLKIRKAEQNLANNRGGGGSGALPFPQGSRPAATPDAKGSASAGYSGQLEKVVRDSNKIAGEEISGMLASVIKERVFDYSALRAAVGKCGHDHAAAAK